MSKVRIGFVGAGFMGQVAHLRNYVTLEDCEVVALAEVRKETGKLVAERYGIPNVYDDPLAMFESETLDAVVASQPFDRHAVLLPELYSRTKFLFTEKPLAVAVDAAQTLADKAAEAGCTHMVGYHKRSDPAVMHAMEVIAGWKASGEMGSLKYVRLLMPEGDWVSAGNSGVLDAGDAPPDLPREVQGGWDAELPGMDTATSQKYVGFVNYYIHQVNLMRYFLGDPYAVTYAETSGVVLAVQSDSGVPGVIEMTPFRTTVDWEESVLVGFEKGYITIQLPPPLAVNRCGRVEIFTDSGQSTPTRTVPTLGHVHAMKQQAANFLRVVRGEIAPPCDAAEAVEDLQNARQYIRLRFGQ